MMWKVVIINVGIATVVGAELSNVDLDAIL
jgi:hypothetical protein